MKRSIPRVLVALACAAALACAGCGESDTLPSNPDDGGGDVPASHTDLQHGVAHMPGKSDPETNCVACHGADLRGGDDGQPSCYSCHGREW